MSIETKTKIASYTVTASGGDASITISNIPQTYTDLRLIVSARTTYSGIEDYIKLSFNGDTTTLSDKRLYGNGNAGTSGATDSAIYCPINGNTATASVFGSTDVYISGYTSSNYKPVNVDSAGETIAQSVYMGFTTGLWSNTAAITSITLTPFQSGNFSQYTTATLYGIKNARKTAGNSIKATGGNISFDGTYVVHTFTASDTFTPTQNLIVDYLVVAGGGGGGRQYGGGGGAGGLRSTVTATGGGGTLESALSVTSGTGYTVTVGGGGAGGTSQSPGNTGTNGSNSVFSTITSTGGGGGGCDTTNGATGGSGGGAGYLKTGGSGTANQGYAGGNGSGSPKFPGGGGGGAGAVGGNATTTTGGNGGNGVAVSISGSSVTYAGGGGGGTETGGTAGTGGTGGGGAGNTDNSTNPVAGTANTGGGGGGGGTSGAANPNGAQGGSGIVIVRYKA